MNWKRKLNKKELKHLKETLDSVTLRDLKTTREWQRENKIECWDCRHIALKLGLES